MRISRMRWLAGWSLIECCRILVAFEGMGIGNYPSLPDQTNSIVRRTESAWCVATEAVKQGAPFIVYDSITTLLQNILTFISYLNEVHCKLKYILSRAAFSYPYITVFIKEDICRP
ncbi:hypothetical protein F5B20DRAFT_260118 [Whalleya microplaca]|nr:hypothetical protein F5B20DRAFT_260118 [Whalleya microplaca]